MIRGKDGERAEERVFYTIFDVKIKSLLFPEISGERLGKERERDRVIIIQIIDEKETYQLASFCRKKYMDEKKRERRFCALEF